MVSRPQFSHNASHLSHFYQPGDSEFQNILALLASVFFLRHIWNHEHHEINFSILVFPSCPHKPSIKQGTSASTSSAFNERTGGKFTLSTLKDNFPSSIRDRGHGLLRTRLCQLFIQQDKEQALQKSENSTLKKALKPTKHRQETHHKLQQITFDPAFAASPKITEHSQILQFINAGVSSNTVSYHHTTTDRTLR